MHEAKSAVMIRELDLSNELELKKVLELQRASYAVEADLIGSSEIPPLNDTPYTLEGCGETFYGYVLEGEILGAISYKTMEWGVDIHRLVVRPDHFRKGIARSLVGYVETVEWKLDRLIVSTGSSNSPAKSFYRSLGFKKTAESEMVPGLCVTFFEKNRERHPGWTSKEDIVAGRGSFDDCR